MFKRLGSPSLRTHLLVLVALAVLPALGIILAAGLERRNGELENARRDCLLIASSLASEQETMIAAARQTLTTLAQLPEMKRRDAAACDALFKSVIMKSPYFISLLAVAPDGTIIASNVPTSHTTVADRKYFKDALARRSFVAGEYVISRTTGKPTLHFALPVLDERGGIAAVVAVGIDLNQYDKYLALAHVPEHTMLVITDHAGTVLHQSPDNASHEGRPDRPEIIERIKACEDDCETIEAVEYDGQSYIVACRELRANAGEEPCMHLRAEIPKTQVYARARLETARSLSLLGLATLAALAIAWRVGETRIVRPVRRLVEASRRLAAGDLGARTGAAAYDGELGELARSFDEMSQALAQHELERNRAVAAMQLMQYAVDHVSTPIAWTGADGTRVYANEAMCRMLGSPREELIGHKMWEINRGMDEAQWREQWEELRQRGSRTFEGHFYTKDGEERLCEVSASYIKFGEQEFMMSFLRDVTEARQSDERLRQAQKMEAIGTLAGGIAHDFNNLLTGILGYANLLTLSAEPGSNVHESARVIEKAAERAAELTRQLLGFARKGKFLNVPFEVQPLVSEVARLIERTLDKNITIVQRLHATQATVTGDPSQIQQVILNLALNARDAMPDGGELTIETDVKTLDADYCRIHPHVVPGRYLTIAVCDTGCGIPKEIQSHIFEPFFTTKPHGKGTGMGLAMVYGIVKNHNGSIQLYSEPGQGARFQVYLPLGQESPEPRAPRDGAAPAGGAGRILLVDDEEIPRGLAQSMLERLGYQVTAFESGAEAVAYFEHNRERVDLVILDMVMPRMDGRECFQALRALAPGVRVMLSSGYSREGRAQAILDEGMAGFIQKPYHINELAAAVRAALGN